MINQVYQGLDELEGSKYKYKGAWKKKKIDSIKIGVFGVIAKQLAFFYFIISQNLLSWLIHQFVTVAGNSSMTLQNQ